MNKKFFFALEIIYNISLLFFKYVTNVFTA